MKLSQQEVERRYFGIFADVYAVPAGRVEYKDKPDIRIHGENLLGIELASLYRRSGSETSSEQVQRNWREKTLATAQSRHIKSGGKQIELTVSFNARRAIADIETVAERLSDLATRIDGLPSGPISRDAFSSIPEVSFVYLNARHYEDTKWRAVQVHELPDLSMQRLGEMIRQKEALLSSYSRCDRYWLLLVVDFLDPAQDQRLVWPSGEAPLRSDFEKVLVYRPYYDEVFEVPLRSADS